ncbi:tripartite motif-containing protein 26-like [Trichechus inunguis]
MEFDSSPPTRHKLASRTRQELSKRIFSGGCLQKLTTIYGAPTLSKALYVNILKQSRHCCPHSTEGKTEVPRAQQSCFRAEFRKYRAGLGFPEPSVEKFSPGSVRPSRLRPRKQTTRNRPSCPICACFLLCLLLPHTVLSRGHPVLPGLRHRRLKILQSPEEGEATLRSTPARSWELGGKVLWETLEDLDTAIKAAASPLRNLEDEMLCFICLDYLRDPLTIDCGHIFCYCCIIKVCESTRQPLYCSLCKTAFKKENICHAWQMASLVENIWRMKVDEERQSREERPPEQRAEMLCGQHLEKLHYYCKDDQQVLCMMCQECREHRPYAVVLLEKVAQPYRSKILNHLKILKGDRDWIQNFQSTGEEEIQAPLTKFQNHRQDIVSIFEQGHQFLREREQCLLEWLEGLELELAEGRNSHVTKGSEQGIRLGTLISELEKKAKQPALALLQMRDQLNCI